MPKEIKNKHPQDVLKILGKEILPGTSVELDFEVAKLHTTTPIEVPIIIERSTKPGPVVLFTAGLHGDEINGVEIVRQLIAKKINIPVYGTIICIPVLNIFGFLHKDRDFPDGRDLNRVFPGSKTGSLASRVAHKMMTEVIPAVDYVIDFHTGGSTRFNAAHIRITPDDEQLKSLAEVFNAPFILYSPHLKKTFRSAVQKKGVPILLFEGGKSFFISNSISNSGVNGSKRILDHLGMLNRNKFKLSSPKKPSILIQESKWIRAARSGMFKPAINEGDLIKKGETIGQITDPFGKLHYSIKSTVNGYVINVNESPLIYQGDALFHVSTALAE
ncbi:succinylglutamate desuccinylase/aspartoacylase family protein [Gangjinia marincola]|uniref:Succinylglutamate desuccinylase/aspartoacylase family protein n=1 Tax=Gangjinia marincola TaxID=578463 RepID=A0ABP3XYL6_9FLAO